MKTQTIIKQLQAILGLFEDKKHWCQGAMAKDDDGTSVGVHNKAAKCYCLVGAARKVTRGKEDDVIEALGETIYGYTSSFVSANTVINFNDSHNTKLSKVRSLIKQTIKRLTK